MDDKFKNLIRLTRRFYRGLKIKTRVRKNIISWYTWEDGNYFRVVSLENRDSSENERSVERYRGKEDIRKGKRKGEEEEEKKGNVENVIFENMELPGRSATGYFRDSETLSILRYLTALTSPSGILVSWSTRTPASFTIAPRQDPRCELVEVPPLNNEIRVEASAN